MLNGSAASKAAKRIISVLNDELTVAHEQLEKM